jgi:NADPH-dependent 2,4-dienoyl-CoA reductase/sulfur reductase-like enzyme/nitrite reductase/ring-hydroxylating ferredoxin subunit
MAHREGVAARRNDLHSGEMRQVSVGGADVLLVRLGDAYHALPARCPHYGGPLAEGVLSGHRVVCPWHHACFDVRTGDLLEPPALDALPRYEVRLDGDEVLVRVPEEAGDRRTPAMARRDPRDPRTFVVLGGGAAGAFAVEALRENGFTGRLLLVTRERHVPYDRPNCSKEYLSGEAPEEWMFFRPAAFYDEHDIERWHERTVAGVDAAARTLTFEDGEGLGYDGLIVCTGGVPRTLPVSGADLAGVHTLRSYDDSTALREAARQVDRVVVVGASFIGMEVAQSLKHLGVAHVTVVAPEAVPFGRVFGERVGRMVQARHEAHGVRFHLGRQVAAFEGEGRRVRRVRLDDGTVLDAGLVVVGAGVRPAAAFLNGVSHTADGAVVVDEYLQAADGLYAAGDIAAFPDWRTGRPIRVEHWRLAAQHGRLAAANLAGARTPYRGVPFFWTVQFGLALRYVGHADGWDDVVYDGEPEGDAFVAYYARDGRVLAACGAGRDADLAAVEALMHRDLLPPPEVLRRGGVDLAGLLRQG